MHRTLAASDGRAKCDRSEVSMKLVEWRRSLLGVAALLALVASASCTLVLGTFQGTGSTGGGTTGTMPSSSEGAGSLGQACSVPDDCAGDWCYGSPLRCQANSCLDGIKDGTETGVDCGGGTCKACPDGDTCRVDSDCVNNFCDFEDGGVFTCE
jgi:hypothetical protein